jgi:hypothetical protein
VKHVAGDARKSPANHGLAATQTTTPTIRAIQALFQLSYSPEAADSQAFTLKIGGTAPLVYPSMCRDMRRSTW